VSRLDLVAGPNGAGKSTFVAQIVAEQLPGSPFVNAEEIARRRWPDDPERHAYEGLGLAHRVDQLTGSSSQRARPIGRAHCPPLDRIF
jgi:predicted ABC-type ATPase